jgi:rare lipoprotein A
VGYDRKFGLFRIIIYQASILFFVSACGVTVERDGAPEAPVDVSSIPDAVPRDEPRSRYGNPESYEVFGKRYYVMNSSRGFVERGIASWYGTKFHGKRTSSGETYDMYAMTAAHKLLPLPTYVKVTNLQNKKNVIVRINDRGPFHENRIIDLSYTAANKLGILSNGTGLVEVRAIEPSMYAANKGAPIRTVALEKQVTPEFYIQVGAFSELINAENLRVKLGSIDNSLIKINQATVDNKLLYRVRIGPLVSVDNADDIVNQLIHLGVKDYHIVVD